ncbi:MAG TPA: hypothetical protein VJB15_07445 [Rhodothermia bacterium]|nr:hypothetical protein [Rhodothermia bacterium]
MIVDSISRSEGKLLRRLAGVAYERELARELDRLSAAFDKWKEKQLSAHDVSAAIHEFHNGVARDLYVLYNRIHPAQTVPRAVAAGLLAEHEVPADLLLKLAKTLDFYRSEFATVERESSPIP